MANEQDRVTVALDVMLVLEDYYAPKGVGHREAKEAALERASTSAADAGRALDALLEEALGSEASSVRRVGLEFDEFDSTNVSHGAAHWSARVEMTRAQAERVGRECLGLDGEDLDSFLMGE